MDQEKPSAPPPTEPQDADDDQDLQMARRALLRAAVYTAPVIVGSVVVTSHAQAQTSCMPNEVCMPWDNCVPIVGCMPQLGPAGCMPA